MRRSDVSWISRIYQWRSVTTEPGKAEKIGKLRKFENLDASTFIHFSQSYNQNFAYLIIIEPIPCSLKLNRYFTEKRVKWFEMEVGLIINTTELKTRKFDDFIEKIRKNWKYKKYPFCNQHILLQLPFLFQYRLCWTNALSILNLEEKRRNPSPTKWLSLAMVAVTKP